MTIRQLAVVMKKKIPCYLQISTASDVLYHLMISYVQDDQFFRTQNTCLEFIEMIYISYRSILPPSTINNLLIHYHIANSTLMLTHSR